MEMQEKWEKALRRTEIIRARVKPLMVFEATRLPYILLAESSVNAGDTVVREGEVTVEKPSIILPSNLPQFKGFESESFSEIENDIFANFLLVRGVRFPSLAYSNKTASLDIREGRLQEAIEFYSRKLEKEENVSAGLVMGPEDCWQFSILIFICSQVLRQADGDIKKLLDDFKRHDRG